MRPRISEDSGRFAHWLSARGVTRGDRVAIKLEPGRAFYAAVFGAMKAGAIAVVKMGKGVQVVMGTLSDNIESEMRRQMKR